MLIGVIYRSPSSTSDNNEKLLKMIEQAITISNSKRLLIMGDFNFPEIDYEVYDVRGAADSFPCRFFDLIQGTHEH